MANSRYEIQADNGLKTLRRQQAINLARVLRMPLSTAQRMHRRAHGNPPLLQAQMLRDKESLTRRLKMKIQETACNTASSNPPTWLTPLASIDSVHGVEYKHKLQVDRA